ncbi:MAG: hypothetical protein WCI11_13320 [Candidatus Methylumidiphilus sp.]
MPESSHKDVKPGFATKPFSNTYATDTLPSLVARFRHPCRNDGNGAIILNSAVGIAVGANSFAKSMYYRRMNSPLQKVACSKLF